ncbi:hypothetical protein JI743_08620 [Sphingopyxis sp. DHUNG17]|uniref:hypothetical protein n=1 Tax=Sphingopyxis jiangsuensis TaxID=2871171 RepID=UPI00191DB35E|nr:hypothetical protein [Sphingopyxis lutea]MBL0768866.1 hypothetical protein [Sphingopyxis lutea]
MVRRMVVAAAALGVLAGCSEDPAADARGDAGANAVLPAGPAARIDKIAAADLPDAVRAAVLTRIPDMTIVEAERKERDGMVFYDVEGTRADGSEIELDILEEGGQYRVVEVQRDIEWTAAPAEVIAAAGAAPDSFTPERVIESTQNDGTVVFELFAPGKPDEPAAEVNWKDGRAELRRERNAY